MVAAKRVLRWLFCGAAGVVLQMLTGCQSREEPQREVSLIFRVDSDVNPDLTQRPSPVQIWVMSLSEAEHFQSADFFTLVDQKIFPAQYGVVKRRTLMLRPGEIKTMRLTLNQEIRDIAVIAGFRDLEGSIWHQRWSHRGGQAETLNIRITRQAIVLPEQESENEKKVAESKYDG